MRVLSSRGLRPCDHCRVLGPYALLVPILSGFGLATVIVVVFSLISASVIMPAVVALTGTGDH